MKSGGDKQDKPAVPKAGAEDNVFDMKQLRRLIRLMETHDLNEIHLEQGDEKVKLRRGGVAQPMSAPVAFPTATAAASAAAPAPPATEGPHIVTIKAPMVGTFYGKPNPDSESFVKVGQRVNADTVVCIIEAMKVFNEIPAEVSGQIVAVLADDQQAVDFDRPLFKVDTSV
ncbi:MAG: acetyl-CoA carboxylase biotin carboxyl carrier protein [Planctomycetaceae bacterium]|nr:MAG: acetyl-CoA carboxylase biotin carboxyl carrier protein [Planctomycetaceae bacterium]